MDIRHPFYLLRVVLVVIWVVVLPAGTSLADDAPAGNSAALLAKYQSVNPKLAKNLFGAPIYLESGESRGAQHVDMYGVFHYPFDQVRKALASPGNWCDITTLHINIKACTVRRSGALATLTIYSGRKYYQPPGDAYPLKLQFRVLAQQPEYLNLLLSADEGPLRTKEHRIRLEAAPLDAGSTFVHFSYAYTTGRVANMAIKTYFATIARDKYGFSTVPGSGGQPVLITGVRGAVERNTVRYYPVSYTHLTLPTN
jgi:hypothetical protein